MEFDVQLAPLPVSISFSDEDVRRITSWLQPLLRRSKEPFAKLQANELTDVVRLLTNFIYGDRLITGPGKGGWGASDRRWTAAVLGFESASHVHDSVLTTCAVTSALIKCSEFKRRAQLKAGIGAVATMKPLPDALLEDYFRSRWKAHTGEGGILAADREGKLEIRSNYRHTARLLRMWIDSMPEYAERIDKTMGYLLERFNTEIWSEESVTTAVAACVAIRQCVKARVCQSQADRLEELAVKLERIIVRQYKPELRGWTFRKSVELPQEIGRQSYTLLTLVELLPIQKFLAVELVGLMREALDETVSGRWGLVGDAGIPLVLGEASNVSMSCLAISALARKGNLNEAEHAFSGQVMSYIQRQLNQVQGRQDGYYSWAVSYFLEDACSFLRDLNPQ